MREDVRIQGNPFSALLYFLRIVAFIISLIFAAVCFIGWCLSDTTPQGSDFALLMSVAMPYMFLGNLAFLLLWTLLGRFKYLVFWLNLAVAVLIGMSMLNYQFSENKTDHPTIKVLTYNIHSFNQHNSHQSSSLIGIAEFLKKESPDIICLQEYLRYDNPKYKNLSEYLPEYPYLCENFCNDQYKMRGGNAVFSKYPIVDTLTMDFGSPVNNALVCDINCMGDTLKIINAHLQTTEVSTTSNELYKSIKKESGRISSFKDFLARLRMNAEERSNQSFRIRDCVEHSAYPVILAGDFNDTPYSYTYKILSGGMQDGFRTCGSGIGYTYRRFFGVLRIDYILYEGIQGLSYDSPSLSLSDHNPVIMQFALKQ